MPKDDGYLGQLDKLADAIRRHRALMEHPEPGLASWNAMAEATHREIKQAYALWLGMLGNFNAN